VTEEDQKAIDAWNKKFENKKEKAAWLKEIESD
jgi:hypothetical protein